ncbi:MAG: CCA tRNA nucleotidyltransferase [Pirellulales bacterium]|nr:CCA tRNA nucleotidyltransferase [Pirellulales bacterium]
MAKLDPAQQREFALEIVQTLRRNGHEALWAGGCVRDHLLGIVPQDYDVATSATPDEIRTLFGPRKTLTIGAAFGVVTVLGRKSSGPIEVATFRSDAQYSDGRHPDQVIFTSAEEDARRRDFTINGLFYDPVSEQVIDYVQGQADLAAGVIRAIGQPAERIHEDKLRMLRAVRFTATFDFQIEPSTLQAIQNSAHGITQVSAERIGMEMRRMLIDRNRARAVELLRQTELLKPLLPEVAGVDDLAWQQTLQVLAQIKPSDLSLPLAVLLHPARDRLTVQTVGRRMRWTNKEITRAEWLLEKIPDVQTSQTLPWPHLQRVLIHEGAGDLIAMAEAYAGKFNPNLVSCRKYLAMPPEVLNPTPLVNGADLIAHGLTPGPEFAPLLEQVRDAQLEGTITTCQEALDLVDRLQG